MNKSKFQKMTFLLSCLLFICFVAPCFSYDGEDEDETCDKVSFYHALSFDLGKAHSEKKLSGRGEAQLGMEHRKTYSQLNLFYYLTPLDKQYGFNIGLGKNYKKGGFILFGDGLFYKKRIQDYKTNFFLNVRPTVKLSGEKYNLFVYYSYPLIKERFTGINFFDEDTMTFRGRYLRSLPYVGVDVQGIFLENFMLQATVIKAKKFDFAILAKYQAFRVFQSWLNFYVQFDQEHYPSLENNYRNTFRVGISLDCQDFNFMNKRKLYLIHKPILEEVVRDKTGPANHYFVQVIKYGEGTVTPYGLVRVNKGDSLDFTIVPASGWSIGRITLDGKDETPTGSFRISNITSNHVLIVWFTRVRTFNVTIGHTPPEGGTVVPEGTFIKNAGENFESKIYPNPGYSVTRIVINGQDAPITNEIKIENINKDYNIMIFFEKNKYRLDVVFNEGGTVTPAGTTFYDHGTVVDIVSKPLENYRIQSIKVNGNNVPIAEAFQLTMDKDYRVEVVFEKYLFEVIVEVIGDGTVTPGSGKFEKGRDITFLINPAAGNEVKSVQLDGQNYPNKNQVDIINIDQDHRIRVVFGRVSYLITLIYNAGGTVTPPSSFEVYYGETARITAVPNSGYIIRRILIDNVEVPVTQEIVLNNVTANHTVQIVFESNRYLVTVIAGAGGTVTPGTSYYNRGSNATFTITPNVGYHIVDVTLDGVSKGPITSLTLTNITADHTITATFAPNTFTVTVIAGPGGTVTPGTSTYTYGSNAVFTITPNPGYHIVDVTLDGVSQGPITSLPLNNITADHTITATFAPNIFTVTVIAGPGGTVTPGTSTYPAGSNATFTITPNTGYHIVDVTLDGVSQGPITSLPLNNINADHTIMATFAPDTFIVTVIAGPGGTVNPGTSTYTYGSNAVFTITPNTGYHILDVTLDGVSQGPITSLPLNNITANHTITATFEINTYLITVLPGPGGTITPGTSSYPYGSDVTFNIVPNDCFHIIDVTLDGVSQGAVPSITLNDIAADHTITATFGCNTYIVVVIAGVGGTVTPGTSNYVEGESPTFTIESIPGYTILDVTLDGESLGPVTSVTIPNINANHLLVASFTIVGPASVQGAMPVNKK